MDNSYGINVFGFFAQLLNFVILFIWIGGAIWALRSLGRRSLSSTLKTIWSLLIVLVPVLGVIAFWLVDPREAGAG